MYDIHPEYFHWDENMDMASLERHIMYMCGFKLNYVTPSEVIQQLYWNSKLALDPSFSASVLDNTLINVANLASYFCLQNCKLSFFLLSYFHLICLIFFYFCFRWTKYE
jgi:hypothetical protein